MSLTEQLESCPKGSQYLDSFFQQVESNNEGENWKTNNGIPGCVVFDIIFLIISVSSLFIFVPSIFFCSFSFQYNGVHSGLHIWSHIESNKGLQLQNQIFSSVATAGHN